MENFQILNLPTARILLTLREWFDYKIWHCVLRSISESVGVIRSFRIQHDGDSIKDDLPINCNSNYWKWGHVGSNAGERLNKPSIGRPLLLVLVLLLSLFCYCYHHCNSYWYWYWRQLHTLMRFVMKTWYIWFLQGQVLTNLEAFLLISSFQFCYCSVFDEVCFLFYLYDFSIGEATLFITLTINYQNITYFPFQNSS